MWLLLVSISSCFAFLLNRLRCVRTDRADKRSSDVWTIQRRNHGGWRRCPSKDGGEGHGVAGRVAVDDVWLGVVGLGGVGAAAGRRLWRCGERVLAVHRARTGQTNDVGGAGKQPYWTGHDHAGEVAVCRGVVRRAVGVSLVR